MFENDEERKAERTQLPIEADILSVYVNYTYDKNHEFDFLYLKHRDICDTCLPYDVESNFFKQAVKLKYHETA